MNTPRILYYTWHEYTHSDGISSLKNLGYHVVVTDIAHEKYDNDEKFMDAVEKLIHDNLIDIVFSFNYFPDLSRVAMRQNIRYISWCFDSPHHTLNSITLNNPCNKVYLFDHAMYEHYRQLGIDTVSYMPLACNTKRVTNYLKAIPKGSSKYQHDITFLGTLYEDDYNFFDQIKYLPPYLKGYIDAAIEAQFPIYGMDMIGHLMRDDICEDVLQYVKLSLGDNYRSCSKDLLISMIQKKATILERKRILTVLGENYSVDHYAGAQNENIPVNFKGYASYETDMPGIFASSKINLNITLRSILSGLPLRIIDILGAGGFCLTNFQSELPLYFENNESIVWYESYEDMFEKVAYYIAHDDERERIALNGHQIIKEQFSYERLFPLVMEEKDFI